MVARAHLAVGADAVHVDPVVEAHGGRLLGIGVGALDAQAVHPVLEGGARRPDDHARPVLQVDVVLVLQAPTVEKNIVLSTIIRSTGPVVTSTCCVIFLFGILIEKK